MDYCISSHLTSYLTNFRNFGPEDAAEGHREVSRIFQIKKGVAEVGFALLAVVAVVEFVAYGILFLASMAVFPLTVKPARFFHLLTFSALSTIVWNIKNLYYNVVCLNISADEPMTDARWLRQQAQQLQGEMQAVQSSLEQLRGQLQGRVDGKSLHEVLSPEMKKALEFFTTILNKDENRLLKANLQSDMSTEALFMLSFVMVTESAAAKTLDLTMFCDVARESVRSLHENDQFKHSVSDIHDVYDGISPKNFMAMQIPAEGQLREALDNTRSAAYIALQGSSLFSQLLPRYLHLNVTI